MNDVYFKVGSVQSNHIYPFQARSYNPNLYIFVYFMYIFVYFMYV